MNLLFALLIDALIGDPDALWRRLPHPAVVMGRAVSALDSRLNRGGSQRLKGTAAIALLVVTGALISFAIEAIPTVGPVFSTILAAILIAQRSLVEHVKAVADGLDKGLAQARQAVSHIVGRDPETLDEAGVARAAIESCAENFSDGVVAPVFWYAVAGLPGIVVYKIVNTADSMIGHRNDQYRDFGWAAARLDDLLNFVPARLSGALICLTAKSMDAFKIMLREAGQHRSPNAGWPEAALAAALGVAIAGPRVYDGVETADPFMNAQGRRDAGANDIEAAIKLIWRAWGWLVVIAVLLTII